ncbi:hypothetical protein GCM10023208_05430 [Erythrobacter westpacificensis]|uniref:Uncharacterized protein n=1 Tax=Erythrobacter westpacificensis TaxID=1055231 RepID=A0ABP9JZU8_9SPHN
MSESSAKALTIMRGWAWLSGDPDGNTWPLWKPIGEAINRLAMEGIERPQNVLIELLRDGELVAEGDYRWRKYQWGRHYSVEEVNSPIKKRQWENLANLLEAERQELKMGGFLLDSVELTNLGEASSYPYECEFEFGRFSLSLCPPDTPDTDRAYYEESFSAWDVQVRPANLDFEMEDSEEESASSRTSRGGRPPAKWWPEFAEELALYVYEEGIPEGTGHEGQSAMIDGIFARMAAAGMGEPSRATVQPVINAVLARTRSAGN